MTRHAKRAIALKRNFTKRINNFKAYYRQLSSIAKQAAKSGDNKLAAKVLLAYGRRITSNLSSWQHDYEGAIQKKHMEDSRGKAILNIVKPGKIVDVYARERHGGVAIYVKVKDEQRTGGEKIDTIYTPFHTQDEETLEEFDQDEDAWLDSMADATNWDEWEWREAN